MMMIGDIPLVRTDFAQVGTTNRGCMKVVPVDRIAERKKGRGLDKVVENSAVDYSIPLNSVPYTLYLFMGDGAITCITCYPLTGNTTPDIIIGKEDGMIEIYTVDETDKAAFKQSYQCEESITGIGCGRVSDEGVDEIIVCTYTGWLFALSSSPLGGDGIATETGRPAPTQNVNVKVQQLKNELDELESKVNEERIRYEDLTKRGGNAHAFVPHFQIHDNFSFNNSLSAYTLTIELVIPIDYIILQSEVNLRMVEVEKNSAVISHTPCGQSEVNLRMVEVEKNSAVISHTPCGQDEVPWNMLATYRCQANTTRIELRMKVDEGNYGFIHVYVCPKIHPKMCQVVPVDRIAERKKGRGLDKIVVGSQNGCVICLCRKHNDTQIVYKTLPGAPVESLCLGGALGTIMDKVFISADNGVRGISKKGKQFFAFDTNMAEPANKMYIYGVELVMCGRKTYYHFHDCVEANYVLLSEDIHDVVSLSTGGAWAGRGFTSIIASNDASLKVVENSAVDYSIPLNSVPYTLYLFMGDGGYNKQLLLYGTKNGHLGLAEAPPKKGTVIWEINTQSASAITCITCYPLTGNTTPDIIIGKEDGMIEIYTVDETDKAAFKQSYQCEESITGIGCGRVSDEGVDEIIVCTYTGWLFALSSSPIGGDGIATETGRPAPTQNVNVKVQQLKNELDELESKVNQERIRYEDLTKRGGNAHAFVPHFQIHDNFSFNNSLSAYTLTIELVIPIDYIILQSEVNLRMVEVEKNSAVISHTPCGQSEVNLRMVEVEKNSAVISHTPCGQSEVNLRMVEVEKNSAVISHTPCGQMSLLARARMRIRVMMMIGDIPLVRTDFAQVGTTNRGCMKVVPVDRIAERKKGRGLDKIVVGSQNGCVICLCRKHNDTQIVYKTLPGAPVESLCLGGALGTIMDKVFISADNGVRGISKKGKQFFAFDTNMAEPANKMYIYGVELVMCGRKTYYHFHDCVEANYVLLSEDIHDVVSLSTGGAWAGRGFTSIIASNDASLKVVENSAVDYSIPLNSVPYTLYLFMGDGGYNKQLLLYGTKNGHLGLAEAPPKKGTVIWEINTQSASAITCITCYPLTGNTTPDIIIGKEDGMIEIYTVDETDKAAFKQSYQCEESITGIGCGRVSDEGVDEIIVCTYTGWLFALSSSPLGGDGIATETGRPAPTQNVNVKVQQLKNELDELESKVNEERIRYEDLTKRGGNAHAFVPHFQIHDNFSFNNSLSAYTLTIELVIPIDYIILQSEVNLRMVEVEKNSAVISHTPCGQDEVPWNMLATYRCQANTTRIELRMKVDEGNYGFIHVYVCPKIHPKMCQVRSYEVKPLAMHIRVHQFDPNRPHNVLSITGNFSLAEAHGWLSQCLPHVPTKCPPQDTVTMNFQSAVDGGTQLQVTYSRGSCLFKSESMSTIAVIRERISEETTRRHLKVNISCELNDKSILHCLKLLHPKMLHLHNVTKKKNIAMALREIEANSDELDWLSLEYEQILKDHDKIFEEAALESLEESTTPTIYEDLLLDRARLTGTTARSRLTALRDLLISDYSLDNVSAFFDSNAD